jgi:hypothetical protein
MGSTFLPQFDPEVVDVTARWRWFASCRQAFLQDPQAAALWDTRDRSSDDFKRATEICKTCPVRKMCVPDAVADQTAMGNRGGYAFDKGVVTAREADKIAKEFGLEARTHRPSRRTSLSQAG